MWLVIISNSIIIVFSIPRAKFDILTGYTITIAVVQFLHLLYNYTFSTKVDTDVTIDDIIIAEWHSDPKPHVQSLGCSKQ